MADNPNYLPGQSQRSQGSTSAKTAKTHNPCHVVVRVQVYLVPTIPASPRVFAPHARDLTSPAVTLPALIRR